MEQMLVTEMVVSIFHSDWYSNNERKFNIDLNEHNDFKHLTDAMKKHNRQIKKEMLSDSSIDLLAVSPILVGGRKESIDYKRFIIVGNDVRVMNFDREHHCYMIYKEYKFENLVKATNFVYSEINNELKEKKKELKA
jgi:hypothetical protein